MECKVNIILLCLHRKRYTNYESKTRLLWVAFLVRFWDFQELAFFGSNLYCFGSLFLL